VWIRSQLEQGVVGVRPVGPTAAALSLAASPSLFHDAVQIRYELPSPAHVDLRVFDVRGREVKALATGGMPGGAHIAVWNGRDDHGTPAGTGVFFVRLVSDGAAVTRRIVRLE
jgi:hypothetical protein